MEIEEILRFVINNGIAVVLMIYFLKNNNKSMIGLIKEVSALIVIQNQLIKEIAEMKISQNKVYEYLQDKKAV